MPIMKSYIKIIISIGLLLCLLIFINKSNSQTVEGYVYEIHQEKKIPLIGANVYWASTTHGVSTDVNGFFSIEQKGITHKKLVFSYVGYMNDTMLIKNQNKSIEVILKALHNLDETVVEARALGTHVSRMEPIYKEVITQGEIQRAACCNLSESFETNASVDVSYSDAVTGAKQIQLLGLSGIYSQIMAENIPIVKGPAIPYGMLYVPGPWLDAVQISKGTASVINGYESITGQINVEYKKPENSEKFYFNMYANDLGKVESSITSAHKLNDKWHTMVLAHAEYLNREDDHNKDGFMDHPLIQKINLFNRYKYNKPGKIESMIGFKILDEKRQAGQLSNLNNGSLDLYKVNINTKRYEAFAKTGFFVPHKKGTSIGTIFSASYHEQKSLFGSTLYHINHTNFYGNIIYETNLQHHKINAGPSFTYDKYDETLKTNNQIVEEIVPGIFAQHTYSKHKLTTILGIRYDYNTLNGHIITPRSHIKYDIKDNLVIRASAGKGYRSSYFLAENPYLLMNSRTIMNNEPLKMEEAVNYGGALTYDFYILGNPSSMSSEYFRTDFLNQVIIDMERNPLEIHIYNLNGKSYSNSAQLSFTTELIKSLDLTTAFRWNDVKTTINEELVTKPLVNQYKGLITLSYLTKNKKWQLDLTSQFNGKSRLPDTSLMPVDFQRPKESPAYTILLGQITYKSKYYDIYLGGENLTNYVQKDPIIQAHNPYGNYFDTSFIWGPISPRMLYVGLRFSI